MLSFFGDRRQPLEADTNMLMDTNQPMWADVVIFWEHESASVG
jgi:hypothetical protein